MKTGRLALLVAGAFLFVTACDSTTYPEASSSGTRSPVAIGFESGNGLNTLASAPVLGAVRGGAADAASQALAIEIKL